MSLFVFWRNFPRMFAASMWCAAVTLSVRIVRTHSYRMALPALDVLSAFEVICA